LARIEELEIALRNLMDDYEGIVRSEFETFSNREPYKTEVWKKAKAILGKSEEG
jgi:hypothetical protein